MQAESLEVLDETDAPPAQLRAIVRAIELELTFAKDAPTPQRLEALHDSSRQVVYEPIERGAPRRENPYSRRIPAYVRGIAGVVGALAAACVLGCASARLPTALYVETPAAGPDLDRAHAMARAWAARFDSGENVAAIDSRLARYRIVRLDRAAALRFFSLAEADEGMRRSERFKLSVFADAPCTLSGRTARADSEDGRLLIRTVCEEDERWVVTAVLEADGSLRFSFANRCASDNPQYAAIALEDTGYHLAYEWSVEIQPGLPRVILTDGPCG